MTALALGIAAAAAGEAAAQASEDRIVVTGARALGRTVQNAVAPIDVISAETVELAYRANLLEQLQASLPSFFVQNVGTPNVGSMVRAGQLRGQNAGHTLVLVNGKRRHSTAFLGAGGQAATAPVDLSTISSASIQRVEVLRDGASAIYGSDAIAGVINIITDKSADGGKASYRYGEFFEGDGQTNVFQVSQGFRIGEGHLRLTGQYDDQKIVIRNSPVNPALLFYFPINPVTGREVLPIGNLEADPRLPPGAVRNPLEATRDNNAWINSGKAPFTLTSFTADFGTPLGTTGLEVYSFLTYAERESHAPQNFRTPNRDANVRGIYPHGYTPVEAIDELDYSALFGIRGDDLGGWRWDLSTVYGRNSIDVHVYNSLNATYGLASPTEFYIGNHTYGALTTNFDLQRSISLFSIPADLSLGLEQRHENYLLKAGDREGYTHGGQPVLDGPRAGVRLPNSFAVSQALPAYRPDEAQDVTRDSLSAYAGLGLNLTDQWTTDLAVRWEDFSDFGQEVTWRVSSRYDITPDLAVRGTVNTGFHAPALAALSYRAVGNANTTTNYTLAVNSPEGLALGASPLQPETAVNYSAGVVARLFDFNIAVDAFQIDVENRITQLGTVNTGTTRWLDNPALGAPPPGQSVSQRLSNGVINPGDGVSYLVNSSDIRTRGVEITIDRSFDIGATRLSLTYAANFIERELTKIYPASPVLTAYNPNITLLSAGDATNLKNTLPDQRHILSASWDVGRFNFFLRQSYWGDLPRSGTIPVGNPGAGNQLDYNIGALWTTDVSASFNVTDRLVLTLAGTNIFEAKPERTPAPLQGFTQLWSYGNNGGVGAEGGFWSAKLDFAW